MPMTRQLEELTAAAPGRPRIRSLLMAVALFLALMLAWYQLAGVLMRWVTEEDVNSFILRSRDSADQIATNLARGLQDEVRRLGNLPELLAADADLRQPLLATGGHIDLARDRARLQPVDIRLSQMAELLELDLALVVDANGLCVASANYLSRESIVGSDLHGRQYFATIESGGRGRQFAFGTVTGIPGVYFSAAIRQDGKFLGGVVVKRAMRNLFRLTTRNAALLVDEFGVVVAATMTEALWHYLPESSAAGLGNDFLRERYNQNGVSLLEIGRETAAAPATLVRLMDDPVPSLMTMRPIGDSGLRLVYFTPLPDLPPMRARARLAFWLVFMSGGLALTLVAGAIFYVLQSRARILALHASTRKLAELSRDLAIEKEVAQAADKAKSRFLAMMSHELRTPFSGILGTVDLLRASPLPPEAVAQVGLLERSARALLALLNNLLDFSKIEAGQLRVESIAFDLKPLLKDVGGIHQVVAKGKGIALVVEGNEAPLVGLGDPNRLRQILDNFLSNAIKFTALGGVRLAAATSGEGAERRLRVRVADSGPGLSQESLAQLFQPFYQVDDSTTRKHGGTGLGLAISRRIAHAMGGEVGVDSQPGQGSCFWLDLPFPATDLPAMASDADRPDDSLSALVDDDERRNILLADDDEVNRLVIGGMLGRVGHRVSFALDGRQAVREIGREDFDLVIMDMHMPELDGVEATRAIRTMRDGKAGIPIIGLTADAIVENRPTYLAAGLDELLTKPIAAADLLAAVRRVTSRATP